MSKTMISFTDAIDTIHHTIKPLRPEIKPISDGLGLVLAEDIFSPIDIPGFNQSAMDGYAIKLDEHKVKSGYIIEGEVAAGEKPSLDINPDNAVRIFTGAAVPDGFDTVVMQEKTNIVDERLMITDENTSQGQNIRPKGAEIRVGDLALKKGTALAPATIGYLAGMGITEISVIPQPKVSIIITGNELKQPGTYLEYGQIYESNSFVLTAALQQRGINDITVLWAKDDLNALTDTLKNAIETSDLVLLTGGISVGKYDFVWEAAKLNDVEQHFYKVKQKPGKPLYFGTKGKTSIFALPGNPASVLTCFYIYVSKAIDLMSHLQHQIWSQAVLQSRYEKNGNLTHFLKGYHSKGEVRLLSGQESFRLSSFTEANCLIKIDESVTEIAPGSVVDILLLP
jgi:molybdopterin molybdotransferase